MSRVQDTIFQVTTEGAAKSGRGMEPLKKLTPQITVDDLTDSATSQEFAVGTLPAGSIIMGIARRVHTLFSGGGAGSATLDVGIETTNTDGYIDGADVFTGGTTGQVNEDPTGPGDGVALSSLPAGVAADTSVVATITSDVNVDTLTAGNLEVEIAYMCLEDPDA